MSNIPYSNVVRSLMYAKMCTRLDIYYVVRMVSRYQSNLGMMHWKTVKRILRYLKVIMDYSFVIKAKNCVWWVIKMMIGQVI
ncbi:hypothetical protein AAG906_037042 [Vitis piasezkii]